LTVLVGTNISSSGEQLKTTNKRIGIKNRFFKLLIFNYLIKKPQIPELNQ